MRIVSYLIENTKLFFSMLGIALGTTLGMILYSICFFFGSFFEEVWKGIKVLLKPVDWKASWIELKQKTYDVYWNMGAATCEIGYHVYNNVVDSVKDEINRNKNTKKRVYDPQETYGKSSIEGQADETQTLRQLHHPSTGQPSAVDV